MQRDLNALTDAQFDLVVIGGGIFGACAACDAAQRGLQVAVVEREDWGGATSANSLKMVHGGIRYLQHLDVARVRHSAHERRAFLRVAPHLVRPLPIVVPTYGRLMRGKAIFRAGAAVYDLLTLDGNRGIADKKRRIPWCHTLSRDRILDMYPGLAREGLTGGAVFCDGQFLNPSRLVLAFVKRAIENGAVAANYVSCTGFLREADKVVGIQARDVLEDKDLEIKARVVVNAAGPYAEKLLCEGGVDTGAPIPYSRDTAFVVDRPLTRDGHAIALQGTTRDPEARVSRGSRHMFVAPWRGHTLVGVWHHVYRGDPDGFTVREDQLQSYLNQMNALYPAWDLTLDDISLCHAGLVPFGDNPDDAEHLRFGRRSHLIDHAAKHGVANLISLIGVRYTTGRCDAARAVDAVFRKLGSAPPRCRTADIPVTGGDIDNIDSFVNQAIAASDLAPTVVRSLVLNYGSEYEQIRRLLASAPRWADRVGASTTILAQVIYAVREEMAQTLGDVVFRRTDLATGAYPGHDALQQCADILVEQFDWDRQRLEAQIEQVASRFPARAVERAGAEDRPPSSVVRRPSVHEL